MNGKYAVLFTSVFFGKGNLARPRKSSTPPEIAFCLSLWSNSSCQNNFWHEELLHTLKQKAFDISRETRNPKSIVKRFIDRVKDKS